MLVMYESTVKKEKPVLYVGSSSGANKGPRGKGKKRSIPHFKKNVPLKRQGPSSVVAATPVKADKTSDVKVDHQQPSGIVHSLEILEWKWEHVTMDFVIHLPMMSRQCDAIWVVVDRLSKSAHFFSYNREFNFDRMERLYIQEIVCLHGVQLSIVSGRDPRFTSRFCGSFQRSLGTTMSLSTTYHPETDGQSESTIRTLEDMMRTSVMDSGLSWQDHLPMIEFAYNNSYYRSIGMAPPELIQQIVDKVELIKKRIKTARDRYANYAKTKCRTLHYETGEHVLLRVSPFRKYVADESHILHPTEVQLDPNLSYVERHLRIIDRKDKVLRSKRIPLVMIQWQRQVVISRMKSLK
ncbi:uncharacterized protein [Henckelia pumila]|uniref:uncharacterized protein n=1 Tax=Henckelia pumila TaxID=405737 RepID=UPI003C6EA375